MAEDIVEDLGRWAEQKARELLELENYQYVIKIIILDMVKLI
jgi:putative endonuclease